MSRQKLEARQAELNQELNIVRKKLQKLDMEDMAQFLKENNIKKGDKVIGHGLHYQTCIFNGVGQYELGCTYVVLKTKNNDTSWQETNLCNYTNLRLAGESNENM